MEPMRITAYQLAKALHLPGIYEIVREQRTISADVALRLGKYFGMTPPQLLAEAIIMGETPTCCAEIFCRLPNSTLDEVSGAGQRHAQPAEQGAEEWIQVTDSSECEGHGRVVAQLSHYPWPRLLAR